MGGRTPGSGSHAFKIVQRHVYGGTVPTFERCIHIWGKTGCQCENAPEENSQYCKGCRNFLITLTDRAKPAEAPQPERADWRAQGPTRDKRKRKAA